MTRYIRNTAIQAKVESTYGTNPGSFTATDAVQIREARFRIDPDVIPRELIRGYMGGSEHLVGSRRCDIEFEVELQGSGTAGTAPAYGQLLRACGMAQTITALSRVEYTPVSTAFESVTLNYHIDGVTYTSRGCRGNVMLGLNAYAIPTAKFKFNGFDTSASTAAVPATNFTAWKRPLVVTDANSGDITLGSTYSAGAISGGTALPSRGMEIDLGNRVSHIKLLGGEAIEITGRETSGNMKVLLTAAQEVTWRTDINANTLSGLSFGIGNVAGSIVQVFMPAVQRINPQTEEYEGRAMMGVDLRVLPSATTGNDEIRVIVK